MNARTRTTLFAALLLTGALLLGATLAQRGMGGAPGTGYGGAGGFGMMGGGYGGAGMMGQGYDASARTLDFDAARAMIQSSSRGATIDPTTNTVRYSGTTVTLDVIAVQPGKPDTTFEIAGLVDPTVEIPRGATVTLNLVNMDYGADMPHGLVITRFPPPYPYVAMPMMGGGPSAGIPPLVARNEQDLQTATYAAGSTQFHATTPGVYYYLCQVPGHAQEGMYGKLIVE